MANQAIQTDHTEILTALRDQMDVLIRVCNRLNDPKPTDQILDDLLLESQGIVNAEAGAVFLKQHNGLRFVCARNEARDDLCIRPAAARRSSEFQRKVIPLTKTSLAGYVATVGEPLRIDDAYDISPDAPYRFDTSIDQSSGYRTKSLLVIPLAASGSGAIGVMQLINRRGGAGEPEPFTEWDEHVARALSSMATLLVKNAQLHERLQKVQLDTIFRLAQAAEFRDNDTGAHIQRVSMYCELIARQMGMPEEFCQRILFAAPMHDVGKLGIPDEVLKKPGKLTDEEFDVMRGHTTIGGKILSGATDELLKMAEQIALSHHEKWNGSGYPNKLEGEKIPIEGRITAVADVFDALTSARVYKPAFPLEKAFAIIEKDAGSHFDPRVVEAFVQVREAVTDIQEVYRD